MLKKNFIGSKNKGFYHISTLHPYHLVDPSPWPILAALGAFMTTTGAVLYMHKFKGGWDLLINGLVLIIFIMFVWWRDVIREGTFENKHNSVVQKGLRLGMILFIISEIMFFFAFFWAFFHSSIAPVFDIGGVWPPAAISLISAYALPLTNTVFLLTSGASITWGHHAIFAQAKKHSLVAIIHTISLAIFFLILQSIEYIKAPFNISDGIFGSCFYMLTGFHGFHVLVGTIGLIVALIRTVLNHFTTTHHVGLESTIWYWHFVDVVWLLLYISVYCWSNR
jgi:cytochrome c oxidase subunit 3